MRQCAVKSRPILTCSLDPVTLRSAEHWICERRGFVERRLDRLGEYLAETADAPAPGDQARTHKENP
jgi:hypothetical protein